LIQRLQDKQLRVEDFEPSFKEKLAQLTTDLETIKNEFAEQGRLEQGEKKQYQLEEKLKEIVTT